MILIVQQTIHENILICKDETSKQEMDDQRNAKFSIESRILILVNSL